MRIDLLAHRRANRFRLGPATQLQQVVPALLGVSQQPRHGVRIARPRHQGRQPVDLLEADRHLGLADEQRQRFRRQVVLEETSGAVLEVPLVHLGECLHEAQRLRRIETAGQEHQEPGVATRLQREQVVEHRPVEGRPTRLECLTNPVVGATRHPAPGRGRQLRPQTHRCFLGEPVLLAGRQPFTRPSNPVQRHVVPDPPEVIDEAVEALGRDLQARIRERCQRRSHDLRVGAVRELPHHRARRDAAAKDQGTSFPPPVGRLRSTLARMAGLRRSTAPRSTSGGSSPSCCDFRPSLAPLRGSRLRSPCPSVRAARTPLRSDPRSATSRPVRGALERAALPA